MLPHMLKQKKSYLDQFEKKRNMARIINDTEMTDVLLPPIQKLNLQPIRKSQTRSRSKSPSKLRTLLTKRTEKRESREGGNAKGDDSKVKLRQSFPAATMKSQNVNNNVQVSSKENRGNKSAPSFNDVINEQAKALGLTDFERQVLGVYENGSYNSEGITEEVDPSPNKPYQIKRLKKGKPTSHEVGLNSPQPEQGHDSSMMTDIETNQQMSSSFKEHAQDTTTDWDWDEAGSERNYVNDEEESLLDKITKSGLMKRIMVSLPENKSKVASQEGFLRSSSPGSFNQSLLSSPSDLLSAVVTTLLDDFICERDHQEGDLTCFECRHKDAFKSLAVNYLAELKYIWENHERHTAVVRYEKIVEVLEVWIYHLCEQNLALGKAYNESVEECEKLRNFLLQSRNTFRSQQWQHDIDRSKIDALSYELSLRDQTIDKLRSQIQLQGERTNGMKEELENAQTDVENLTALIVRLRDHGLWDVHGLSISDAAMKKISSEDYYLHGSKVMGHKEFSQKKKEWRNEIEQLKTERETLKGIISTKDKEIQKVKTGRH